MNRPRPRRGFTLIELLVTLGVIGLLVGILLPVVSRVRAMGEATACLANVRQVGVLLNAYLVESDGRLPVLQNRLTTADPGPALDTLFAAEAEALRCPADDAEIWRGSGTSYFWNFTVNGQRIEQVFSIVGGRDAGRVPLVSDKEGFHPELQDRVVVLYADGHAAKELTFSTTLQP